MNDQHNEREIEQDIDQEPAWPHCPECDWRRQTICPTCELAGDEFHTAEYQQEPAPLKSTRSGCCGGGAYDRCEHEAAERCVERGPDGLLVVCPACGEAFAPVFYRRCERCGHDFGDGREPTSPDVEELSTRVWVVIWGLAGLLGGMFLYFWLVLRG
jgi:hypothetical protein